jgi:hypothetical protein
MVSDDHPLSPARQQAASGSAMPHPWRFPQIKSPIGLIRSDLPGFHAIRPRHPPIGWIRSDSPGLAIERRARLLTFPSPLFALCSRAVYFDQCPPHLVPDLPTRSKIADRSDLPGFKAPRPGRRFQKSSKIVGFGRIHSD